MNITYLAFCSKFNYILVEHDFQIIVLCFYV